MFFSHHFFRPVLFVFLSVACSQEQKEFIPVIFGSSSAPIAESQEEDDRESQVKYPIGKKKRKREQEDPNASNEVRKKNIGNPRFRIRVISVRVDRSKAPHRNEEELPKHHNQSSSDDPFVSLSDKICENHFRTSVSTQDPVVLPSRSSHKDYFDVKLESQSTVALQSESIACSTSTESPELLSDEKEAETVKWRDLLTEHGKQWTDFSLAIEWLEHHHFESIEELLKKIVSGDFSPDEHRELIHLFKLFSGFNSDFKLCFSSIVSVLEEQKEGSSDEMNQDDQSTDDDNLNNLSKTPLIEVSNKKSRKILKKQVFMTLYYPWDV
jgi:hypothetical protein